MANLDQFQARMVLFSASATITLIASVKPDVHHAKLFQGANSCVFMKNYIPQISHIRSMIEHQYIIYKHSNSRISTTFARLLYINFPCEISRPKSWYPIR